MAVSLPQDVILFQIITRVPTKIAVRFMCVSKQWNSFLMSNRFKEMHNDRNVYPNLEDQNLLFLSEKSATFYTIDCESPPDNAPCGRPLPQFATHPPEEIEILTSFHGLVCLGIKKNARADFEIILWNPVTNEYKRLSKPSNPDHMECYIEEGRGHGLYYCSGENDYKLLVVTDSNNAYIYSLKSDSWRKLDTKPPIQDIWTPGFYLNQYLYFLCYMDPDSLRHEGVSMSMKYDTKANRFHTIKPPPLPDGNRAPSSTAITVHKGSIHLCVMYDYNWFIGCTCIELWKFIADGDIWSKMVTYQLTLRGPYLSGLSLYPVHLMSNGNLLMIDAHKPVHICQVDLTKKKYTKEKKDCHKSEDKNESNGNYHDEYKLLYHFKSTVDWSDKVRYTETFVSPNQYMK